MSRSYLSFFIICFTTILIISSCKRDTPNRDQAIIEVDFLLNERDLEKFGLDYTEQEFERDNNDPNKVLTVAVGEPVKFKDTSKGSSSTSKRMWKLNGNEWEQAENDKEVHVPEFTHVFEEPGYHRISLYIEDVSYATKLIKVVSEDFAINNVPTVENEMADANEDLAVVDPQPEKEDLFAETNTSQPKSSPSNENSRPTSEPSKPKVNNTPPPPAKISNVDFRISGDLMVGNTIELRDLSTPSSAIYIRQWDMGDGTTQKTKGGVYNQIYFSSGDKTITLCLNNSNQCISKTISIKPRPARKETAEVEKAKPTPPKAPEITNVEFKIPSTAVVGTAVNLSDRSQPSSAVMKRKWSFGDGSPDLNTGKSAVSHVFNKAGTYEVKLCLNDLSNKCSTESITITEKPEATVKEVVENTKPTTNPTNVNVSTPNWLDNYDGTTPGRVGLLSSQKCDETTSEWYEGAAFININPKKPMELDVAKVYASRNGTVDIILTTGDKKETGVLKNVQVNPGPSNIYLTDLAIILEPGEKYTLLIKPSDPDSGLRLENAVNCNPRPLPSDVVSVNYNDKYILYDLKFFY
ncbi:PKD domain-containing protein [Portibacter marinus]|uniref:PKD domain-containing protein n=1 Tax=Portibacter marinus TaxID=2898660 RepID=UPI001F3FDB8F|nr:PKD domain-containing protein [Portibacter marinus]